jgi:hypothetical protein
LVPVVVGSTTFWFECLSTFVPGVEIPPSVVNFVNLYDNCFEGCAPGTIPINQAAIVTFAAVPEPSPFGLVLGALGAGWLVRRRKAH